MSDCEIIELDPLPAIPKKAEPRKAKVVHDCKICGKVFTSFVALRAHRGRVKCPDLLNSKYTCTLCDRRFNAGKRLWEHRLKVHGLRTERAPAPVRSLICLFCGHKAKNVFALTIHNRTHTGEKPFECKGCKRGFAMSSGLTRHLGRCKAAKAAGIGPKPPKRRAAELGVTQDQQGRYECSKCNYKNKYYRNIREHLSIHGDTFKCPHCPAGFKTAYGLTTHKKAEHPEQISHAGLQLDEAGQTEIYKCTQCNYRTPQRTKLGGHEQTHGDKFKCPSCPTGFNTNMGLLLHQKLEHPKEVPSNIGRENAQTKVDMKNIPPSGVKQIVPDPEVGVQISKHPPMEVGNSNKAPLAESGFRSFVCLFCGHDAKTASALTVHHRNHSKERPFECKGCGKRFKGKRYLNRHMRICQSAEAAGIIAPVPRPRLGTKTPYEQRKYKCALCNFRANGRKYKDKHEATHGDKFKCHLCPVGFKFKPGLKHHQSLEHPEQVPHVQPKKAGKECTSTGTEETFENNIDLRQSSVEIIKSDPAFERPDESKCEDSEDFMEFGAEIDIKYEHDLYSGQIGSDGLDNINTDPDFEGPNSSKCDQSSLVFEDSGEFSGTIPIVKLEAPPLTALDVESEYIIE